MIKIGIVGYGNLGKAVEREIAINKELQLVKIFSRRNIKTLQSPFGSKFEKLEKIANYSGKIDLLFLCSGSFSDIEKIGLKAIKNFCTVDAFDTHSKLHKYKEKLDKIAKENYKVGLTAFGWDPGILSQIRTVFAGLAGEHNVSTFWGEGVSQGHSDALRRIDGVENAIQFTIPNKKEIKKVLTQPNYRPTDENKHHRLCYVALKDFEENDNNLDKNSEKYAKNITKSGKNSIKNDGNRAILLKKRYKIRKQIREMPNYFAGQKTTIHFVDSEKVKEMQKNMKHKGLVVSHFMLPNCHSAMLKFEIEMHNNPSLTARIMIVGGKIAMKFYEEEKFGGYSILDIPPKYFLNKNDKLL